MQITKEILEKSKVINEGTTCYIMQYGPTTYKVYKGTIKYINGTGEYGLEEKEVSNRLNYIVSKKKDVVLTDLPTDVMIYDEKPVGVVINYYNNSVTLKDYLLENGTEEITNMMRQQVLNIVEELIKNGIIPTDPHLDNFLVCYKEDGSFELKMIDTDDQYISIYPDNKRDIWYDSEVSACYRVIDLAFEDLKNKKSMI